MDKAFYRGFIIAIPLSLGLWALIVTIVRHL